MPEKTCKHCGELKPFEKFPRDKCMRDGRRNMCYACTWAKYRKRGPRKPLTREQHREAAKRWRSSHREQYREYQRNYHREWSQRNPDKIRGYKVRRRARLLGRSDKHGSACITSQAD